MEKLRQLQLTELKILKETLRLFEENGISYFALCGTMLGAVRHGGFVPWDDDIDIGVPREDYERLRGLQGQLPPFLRLCSFQDDPDYNYYILRVEDDSMTVTSNRTQIDEVTSAWIDIFPLDGMPNGAFRRKLHGWNILIHKAFFQIARFDSVVNLLREGRPLPDRIIIWTVRHFRLQRLFSRRRTFRSLDKTLKKFPYAASDFNINAMSAYKLREMVDKRIFGEGRLYDFEDIRIRGPQDYEAYLTQLYGDWRTPADFSHHSVVDIQ